MDFVGKAVGVNTNAGLFVTLNPAGKGYGGRSKLPDNLQQMFRCANCGLQNHTCALPASDAGLRCAPDTCHWAVCVAACVAACQLALQADCDDYS